MSGERSEVKTALVVDDDDSIRELVKEVLQGEGYTVLESSNGRKAAKVAQEHPDISLIVTDILMPDEDGIEFICRIRRSAAWRGRPPKILAISGGGVFASHDLYLANATMLGADGSLSKPFSDTKLLEALHELGMGSSSQKTAEEDGKVLSPG